MNMVGIIVVSLILLIVVWMVVIIIRAQKLKGALIPKTDSEIDEFVNKHSTGLIYFYSVNCGQCVTLTPIVDEMIKQGKAVMKMDITTKRELATTLNIRATPTLMVIKNKQIEAIHLGTKPESFVHALID